MRPVSLQRARLALGGTIALCTLSTFQTLSSRAMIEQSIRKNDVAKYQEGLQKYAFTNAHFTCSRRNLEQGRYYTLLTSAWNHGSLLHYVGNILGLFSFGRVIAYTFGARTFLAIFYGGAVAGNVLCLGLDERYGASEKEKGVHAKQNKDTGGFIGASGGVCAIMAANACLNPLGSMVIGIMFIPVPVPNFVGALGFAAFSAWAQTNNFQGKVAHLGHLGGLVYGFAWYVARFRGLPMFR